ncbi:MAG TPA: hypothetical protein VGC56_03870 [Allosphingosinicella sp.]|jgi:hypothetical protein
MNARTLEAPAVGADYAPIAGEPAPLIEGTGKWGRWLSLGFSAAILLVIVIELRRLNFITVLGLIPVSAAFWATFVAYYFSPVIGDWIIYRHLWRLPRIAFVPLMRKFVSNELLLGYSGEVYFYSWARKNARLHAAPFGAVRDVSILSAVAGNGLTFLMVVVLWPIIRRLSLSGPVFNWSLLALAVSSLGIVLLQRRFLSLSKRELRFVLSIQSLRICVTTFLGILLWQIALPAQPLILLIVLGALRLLLSRLPFLPNKEAAFAAGILLLLGKHDQVTVVVTMVATVVVLAHILVGLILSALDFAGLQHRGVRA